jgi:SPP1 gp7 family putative phage head morphogenesis protein
MSLEREYARILRDYTRGVNQICKDYLPYMVDEAMANSVQADMREDSWISDVTDRVKQAIDSKLRITDKISAMFEKVKGFAKSQQGKIFTSIFGSIPKQRPPRDYEMLKQIWTSQNLTLIKSIDDRTMEAIHYTLSRNVIRTVDRKELVSELTQTIKHMAGVNEKRAALIACDQVGKLNSQLAQYEQVNQGVDSYIWQTMMDNRVRPEHAERQGKRYYWNDPPSGGHPGWSYRCRCSAIPLYDTDKIGLQPKAGSYKKV